MLDQVGNGDQAPSVGDHAGLFTHLARRGSKDRLAQLLQATRQAPGVCPRRLGAPHQQDTIIAPDDDTDADQWPLRILPLHGTSS
jgi:hypothetical protein